MGTLYPPTEPYDNGMLEVDGGDLLYWETCGDPQGAPAVVLHGGPGSGCAPWFRGLFDPSAYRVVLFDQRNCGRSRPHASDPATDLSGNTTSKLVDDIEVLRRRLGVESWVVCGGSWGSTLALAYAETHPQRVTRLLLWGVTTGRREEFDWLFRGGAALFFPEQWARLLAALPPPARHEDVVEAYHGLLNDADATVRERATEAWCMWESATVAWPPITRPAERFMDAAYAYAFARIVVHYVRNDAWVGDGRLLRGADVLGDIPGVMVCGRFDFQAPIGNAYALRRAWPRAELVVVDDAGHSVDGGVDRELVRVTDRWRAR